MGKDRQGQPDTRGLDRLRDSLPGGDHRHLPRRPVPRPHPPCVPGVPPDGASPVGGGAPVPRAQLWWPHGGHPGPWPCTNPTTALPWTAGARSPVDAPARLGPGREP